MHSTESIATLYHLPLIELVARAMQVHRAGFPNREVQLASLLSIKTGGCPENCAYCPQSAHHSTGIRRESLLSLSAVKAAAASAKQKGATRFCMGAAWREVKDGPDFERVLEIVGEVNAMGLEACCTLGMISSSQAERLKQAGLHSYNHNIDSSRSYYERIITTREYDDRLRTIGNVRNAGLNVCTGGIIGMGETDEDRIDFLAELAGLFPESVTINALIPMPGTPLADAPSATPFELARVIAVARVLIPKSMIRLSAGRHGLSEEGQFLCFLAGANSIFLGEKLLTSANPSPEADFHLLERAGLNPAATKVR